MTNKSKQNDSKTLLADLDQKAFRFFDEDNSGKISFKNLKRVAKELGEPLTDDYLKGLLEDADRDGDGEIGYEEYMRIMRRVTQI